jgi:hypothetical protein
MSDQRNDAFLPGDWVRKSLLYQHFHALREEVLKHKWYESEKAGYDIGFDLALTDWTIKYRSQWLRDQRGPPDDPES